MANSNYISNFVNSEFSSAIKFDEKQNIGIAGFYMMAVPRQRALKSSTVPVIPLEDGSNASDHFIKNPIYFDIEGTVADVYQAPTALATVYQQAVGQIGNIDRFLPTRTRQEINKINAILLDAANVVRKIDDYINAGEQVYNLFTTNSEKKGLSQQFLDLMNAITDSSSLIQIELPFQVYDNIAVTGFETIYRQEYGKSGFDFRMSLQQFNFTQTVITDLTGLAKNPAPAVADQNSPSIEKGINKTKPLVSALSAGGDLLNYLIGKN